MPMESARLGLNFEFIPQVGLNTQARVRVCDRRPKPKRSAPTDGSAEYLSKLVHCSFLRSRYKFVGVSLSPSLSLSLSLSLS